MQEMRSEDETRMKVNPQTATGLAFLYSSIDVTFDITLAWLH